MAQLGTHQISGIDTIITSVDELKKQLGKTGKGTMDAVEEFKIKGDAPIFQFELTHTPNSEPVSIEINHVVYRPEDIKVEGNIVKWMLTEKNGGFDITTDITDVVYIRYSYDIL